MLNHITLQGRLTKDPELRTTQNGVNVATFTIACDRDFQQGGSKQTDFINCVAWRGTADFVSRYFHKGQLAVVSGRLQSRKWTDRDNKTRTEWEVICDNVYFGESKKTPDVEYTEPPELVEVEDAPDLPF